MKLHSIFFVLFIVINSVLATQWDLVLTKEKSIPIFNVIDNYPDRTENSYYSRDELANVECEVLQLNSNSK